jgi:thymidylate kinase
VFALTLTLDFNPEMFLQRIGKRKTTREYKNKEPIFTQGAVADAIFYGRLAM